jgi:hypothetical protein
MVSLNSDWQNIIFAAFAITEVGGRLSSTSAPTGT